MSKSTAKGRSAAKKLAAKAVALKKAGGVKLCPAGHITDEWGYCQIKNCKHSRDYKNRKRSIRK